MLRDHPATVTLRPIATPLPPTFAGLLIASVVISGYELRWVPHAQLHATGWVLLAVPIPLQLLAACWGFLARSAAAATGSGVLAATWIAFALDAVTSRPGAPGPSNAVAMLMFGAAGALLVPVLAELRDGSLLPAAVLTAATIRFVFTGVSGMTHSASWVHASGWTGIAVAAAALYGALALELEGTASGPLLPTFRVGGSRAALAGTFEHQVAALEHEPGVRRTL